MTGKPSELSGAEVKALDKQHVFHSWSAQAALDPMAVQRAEGSYVWDYDGNRFLDFGSQLVNVNIGHQHPKLVAAIQEQAARMCTIAPATANDARSLAAQMITDIAPEKLTKVFFTNGGADANEYAIRLAKGHTGRHKVMSTYRSYHGATAGVIGLTGDPRRWANEPSAPGAVHFWGPYPYRSPFHSDSPEQESQRALQHLRDVVAVEGPQTIAAIVLESVVGTNGILVPPPGYLAGVREICDEFGIVMIADEVMSGFGRCGEWFAIDAFDVAPDLITFAKGVNSGYVPLGGVVIHEDIAATYDDKPFPGGLTYSGHPLACGSAVASMQIFAEEDILGHVRRMASEVYAPRLAELADRHPSVGEVRGLGAFWALELVKDRETREPLVPFNASGAAAAPMGQFTAACKERGLIPFTHFNRTHVVPPLTTTRDEALEGIAILDEALKVADQHYTG